MKVVLQRVKKAEVRVGSKRVGKINQGLLVLLGIHQTDSESNADWLAKKVVNCRIFQDENDKMNLSCLDIKGSILLVSQFTLYGDASKGNRPSFIDAARPEQSEPLYNYFCKQVEILLDRKVEKGVFGAMMDVDFINDGPVTIIIESKQS